MTRMLTWMLLGLVIGFLIPGIARGRRGLFFAWRSWRFTATGVEGARNLSKKEKDALNAASSMLR